MQGLQFLTILSNLWAIYNQKRVHMTVENQPKKTKPNKSDASEIRKNAVHEETKTSPEQSCAKDKQRPLDETCDNQELIDITSQDALIDPDAKNEPENAELKVKDLLAERAVLKEKLLRALADGENTRKRANRDRAEAERYGGTKLARDVLSVHDNLQRALDTVKDEQKSIAGSLIEGVELTLREIIKIFDQHGISPIKPKEGDIFNPQHHQAMFEAPVPNTKAGQIIQIMEIGFLIHDRLLRPAKVGVSSNPNE